MTRLTDDELQAILAGCNGVTPGPWQQHDKHEAYGAEWADVVWGAQGPGYGAVMKSGQPNNSARQSQGRADAAHIARLDPQTVSALVAELLEARKALAGAPFRVGDEVETVKGAMFRGEVVSVYRVPKLIGSTDWRCDVYATDPAFEGTIHVYPASQLRLRPTQSED